MEIFWLLEPNQKWQNFHKQFWKCQDWIKLAVLFETFNCWVRVPERWCWWMIWQRKADGCTTQQLLPLLLQKRIERDFHRQVRSNRPHLVIPLAYKLPLVKADSHIACRSPAMPCVNPHTPCRAPALLRQCRVLRECPHGSRKYPTASPTV